jgi:hypothetical protein
VLRTSLRADLRSGEGQAGRKPDAHLPTCAALLKVAPTQRAAAVRLPNATACVTVAVTADRSALRQQDRSQEPNHFVFRSAFPQPAQCQSLLRRARSIRARTVYPFQLKSGSFRPAAPCNHSHPHTRRGALLYALFARHRLRATPNKTHKQLWRNLKSPPGPRHGPQAAAVAASRISQRGVRWLHSRHSTSRSQLSASSRARLATACVAHLRSLAHQRIVTPHRSSPARRSCQSQERCWLTRRDLA